MIKLVYIHYFKDNNLFLQVFSNKIMRKVLIGTFQLLMELQFNINEELYS